MLIGNKSSIHVFNKSRDALVKDATKRGKITRSVVLKIIAKLNGILKSDDPRLNGMVSIIHNDGSHFFFNYAFVEILDGWGAVFTEHNGVYLFKMDEIEICLSKP